MEDKPQSATGIAQYLPWAERVFLALGVLAALMWFNGKAVTEMAFVAVMGLALVYFLSAFLPAESKGDQDKPMDFMALFRSLILPKIAFLGLSVALAGMGLHFFIGSVETEYDVMVYIGTATLGVILVFLIGFFITAPGNSKALMPLAFRVILVLALATYVMMEWL